MTPLILHTPGEPAGIGPELLIKLAQKPSAACRVAITDPDMLRRCAAGLRLPLSLRDFDGSRQPCGAGELGIVPVPLPGRVAPGEPDPANAASLLEALRIAVQRAGEPASAIVTGPLNKAVINAAGIAFSGHTEFIAAACGAGAPVMMLVAGDLRVALATTHLPLRAVPEAITADGLEHTLRVLIRELIQRFGIARPRIQVLGLNPHAGEDGHLGQEDAEIIAPVIACCGDAGAQLLGPVPADTAFSQERLAACDAVLAMYHDQGLPVLKHAGFGRAVNVTLGLPVIRCSVDHGTAFDIAGRGIASIGSLEAAEELAIRLAG